MTCPWCGSTRVERLGEFGPQLMGEPYLCLECRSPFERIRKRGEDDQG
ncbi:PaaD-like zinc ribbon domain-containing protein [Thermus filiformis]